MQIAVTCQNRRTITEHAGKCRNFWVYEVDQGTVASKHLVALAIDQNLHASHGQLPEPLAGINVLITASMGAGLQQRLKQNGILPIITVEDNPDTAVAALLANELPCCPAAPAHHCGEHSHHH